jgi:uncharacterized membrane protein YeaQ/YmgE (transglycosylase-associated protein family)
VFSDSWFSVSSPGQSPRAVNTGPEPGGLLGTLFVGILGPLLGGIIASAAGLGGLRSFFSVGTWVVAIAGAFVLLIIYSAVAGASSRRRHPAH